MILTKNLKIDKHVINPMCEEYIIFYIKNQTKNKDNNYEPYTKTNLIINAQTKTK